MTANMLRASLFFLGSLSFAPASAFVLFAMIGEVNRKVPDQRRISYLFGYFNKYLLIFREYRRLYPDGRLAVYCYLLSLIALTLFVVSAWQIGLFR